MGEVVSPLVVTYSVTFHQWLTTGVLAMRTLPTICVHMCTVLRVPAHASSGSAGQTASSCVSPEVIGRQGGPYLPRHRFAQARTGEDFWMATTQIPSQEVPMRPMEFDEWLDDLPKHFARDGDIVGSHVLTVLSSVFPDGEDFFVRSVERVRDRINDPHLRENVEGFIGQESMHGREHLVLNERLAELGYPTRAIGTYIRKTLAWRERIQSEKFNLAVTAALEHYTATLAETLLGDPEARAEVAHEGVRNLLMWHALEESEHKAVAFDVYKAVGGSERMRKAAM